MTPSARAVLRLIARVKSFGCWTGKSAGLAPPNLFHQGRKLAKTEREALTVAHESAFFSHLGKLIDRRHRHLRQPLHDRRAPDEEL